MLFTTSSRQPRPQAQPRSRPHTPHPRTALSDSAVRAMFARARVLLTDGAVPVEGVVIGWQRTSAGLLGAIVANPLTGARFLYGPDLATGGHKPRFLTRLA